jgi:hypothetical protein
MIFFATRIRPIVNFYLFIETFKTELYLKSLLTDFFHVSMEDLDLARLKIPKPDLVYSMGVLHHTVSPALALRNIANQCESGTEFRFMLYAKNSYKSALIQGGLDQFEAQDNVPLAETYTRDEAIMLFENEGISVESVSQTHIFPFNIDKYKQYEYVVEPWFAAMPTELFECLKRQLGWHLLIVGHKR